jgi:hypothetical protein
MDSSIISITQGSLASQAIRQIIGTRSIDLYQTYRTNSRGASRGGRLKGFINMLGVGGLDYLMSNLTSIIMGAALTLYNFDWNKTDEEIKKQMETNDLSMITAAGRLAADGLIRFSVMGSVKQAKHRYPRIDPVAIAMLEEENNEELINEIRSFLMAIRGGVASNAMLTTYMSGRQMLFGAKTKKTESFIISDRIEKIAEEQKNPQLKAFLTGFVDQAEDVIFDMAYLVCNTIQATYEMNKLAARQGNGPARVVQLTPDKSEPELKTIIYGAQQEVMTSITNVLTQNAIIDRKDVGQIAQVSIDRAIKADRNERLVTVFYYSGVNGASTLVSGKRAQKKEYTISNVKVSVDWDKLKEILTPIDGGNYKVVAHLDDGHQLQGHFLTEAEGRAYHTKVADALCKGNIVKFTTIEPNSDVKFRVDPARYTVAKAHYRIARKTSNVAKKTMTDSNGQFWRVKTIKLKLRLPDTEKPAGIDEMLLNPWVGDPD